VSIGPVEEERWDPRALPFAAILDPGNNHNFALGHAHLTRWAGLAPERLPPLRPIRERGQRIPVHAAALWLHANVPGSRRLRGSEPFLLNLERGIAVYPAGDPLAPRLPLLGLRALTDNRLITTIDGARRHVTIRTAGWWWWPFG
jgi:hypothetical protein